MKGSDTVTNLQEKKKTRGQSATRGTVLGPEKTKTVWPSKKVRVITDITSNQTERRAR